MEKAEVGGKYVQEIWGVGSYYIPTFIPWNAWNLYSLIYIYVYIYIHTHIQICIEGILEKEGWKVTKYRLALIEQYDSI